MTDLEEVTKGEYVRVVSQLACDYYNIGEKDVGLGMLQTLEVIDSMEKLGYCVHYFYDYDLEEYSTIITEKRTFYVGDLYDKEEC